MRARAAALILCLTPIAAQARPAPRIQPVQEFAGDRWVRVSQGGTTAKDVTRHMERRKSRRRPVPVPRPRPGVVAPLAGIVAPLAAKVREICAACGSKVISGVRHTYIRGTGGRLSLHASGRAVDIKGNPACIAAHLRGWPGGASTDYSAVQHTHISYAPGGPEWGLRFRHGGHRRHKHKRRA